MEVSPDSKGDVKIFGTAARFYPASAPIATGDEIVLDAVAILGLSPKKASSLPNVSG